VLQDEIRRNDEARYDHKLHAVLMATKSMTCPKIAEVLGDSERTIRNWINAYLADGLQGLVENERTGRPKRLSDEQMDEIQRAVRKFPEEVGLDRGIWDGKTLSAFISIKFGISLGTRQCQRMFRELGFRLRKPRPLIARSKPELQRSFKKKRGDT
jgi:transposase